METPLKIGLIGSGFIGRSHALAIKAVSATFSDCPLVVPESLADIDAVRGKAFAERFGFAHFTTDWRETVARSDAIIIAVPSVHHAEIAQGVIAEGKPFLCEKPVGLSSLEAQAIAEAAARKKVIHAVGYTYVRTPLVQHAKRLLDSGRFGRIMHFYGRHFEDYLSSPDAPFSWRLEQKTAGRCGALGDLGCHILSIARFLCGNVRALSGTSAVIHPKRRAQDGGMRQVENEDHAAALLRFADGAQGVIEVSRVATGRKMDLAFEVTCERGALRFDAERMNELQVYLSDDAEGSKGFRRILAEPGHGDYAAFLPAPGHGLGFNDLKTIEIAAFLRGISTGQNIYPALDEAVRIGRLCEAILDSAEAGTWISNPEDTPLSRRVPA